MAVTPVSGINLMYWNILPMGVANYGGDLQIFNMPDYSAGPLEFYMNPVAQLQIATQMNNGFGGGYGTTIDMGTVDALAQAWSAPVNQQYASQQFSQATQGVNAIKTKLAALETQATNTEDAAKVKEYQTKVNELEAELENMKNTEGITTQEVARRAGEIEGQLRTIATEVGELSTRIAEAAQQAAQQAQETQQEAQTETQGNGNGNAKVTVENADPEAERRSQT